MRALLIVLQLSAALLAASAWADDPDWQYPGESWTVMPDPADIGWSTHEQEQLQQLLQTLNTQALHVSVAGQEIFSWGEVSDDGYLASVRKSLLAILYGPYVESGSIDLDARLGDLSIDDVGGLLDSEREATVRDVISARSGVYHPAANGGDNTADAPPRGSQKPGSYFLYNNWDFNVAGSIFEQQTGRGIFQALNDQLAVPLGFEDFDLSKHEKSGNPERSQHLAYHMHVSARDLARVGHLMLSMGQWNGQQLISSEWVTEMTTPHTDNAGMNPASVRDTGLEYGYMWWLFDDDTSGPSYQGAYAGRGHYGQYLAVFPALDLVISHKTRAVPYNGADEYEAVRVSWPAFMRIVTMVVDSLDGE